uniref:Uncharacterized protein n=1 Tax=Rangifer tarandus platyrhynchus TaxID=3082113 RepID=A0ACB0ET85_RANTA|nr:unnamed protein product [Rangifer tarandus platyrhynchus]
MPVPLLMAAQPEQLNRSRLRQHQPGHPGQHLGHLIHETSDLFNQMNRLSKTKTLIQGSEDKPQQNHQVAC